MARTKSKSGNKGGSAQGEQERQGTETNGLAEELFEDREPEAEVSKNSVNEEEFTIDGQSYKPGDTLSVSGQEFTLVTKRHLKASSKAGVADGEYPVVSVTLQPGNRTAYRALVGDDLYPIRQYGTPGEVISKVRESGGPRKRRKEAPAPERLHEAEETVLSDDATDILEEYLSLKPDLDRTEVLSDLVSIHLGPEVKRLRSVREAVARLPAELLDLLVNAPEEKRKQLMDLLK